MTSPFSSTAIVAVRGVLRNAALRRIEIAWTAGTAADGAFLVVLLVVAYDAGGALAAGILGAIRVIPWIVSAPFAPRLVVRFRGDRVLAAINAVRSIGAIATAAVVATGLPMELMYVLAAVVAGAGSLVRPIQTALLPAFARSPRELVAANVASSMGEGVGTFVGPLLAGILVATTGSVSASVLVAAVFAAAAAALTGIRFEQAADARGRVPESSRPRLSEAPTVLRRYPTALLVIGDFAAQSMVRGMLITLIVVGAIDLLDMGDTGVGILTAAIGLGGLAGATGALALKGGGGLGRVFVVALACWGAPLMLVGAVPVAAIAVIALLVTGFANAILDVSGFTLMQRGVRNDDRVTVFGAGESTWGSGLFVGSLLAPALVALLGARGAFLAAGAILPLLAMATARPIVAGTRSIGDTEAQLALLRRNQLFAPLPLTALDRLAAQMAPVAFERGEVVMRKGDPGDRYLLIAEGQLEVTDEGRHLRTCGPGDGVGEIALLRRVPRTATVAAMTDVDAFTIDAPTFIAAVSGPAASAAAEALTAERLADGERQLSSSA